MLGPELDVLRILGRLPVVGVEDRREFRLDWTDIAEAPPIDPGTTCDRSCGWRSDARVIPIWRTLRIMSMPTKSDAAVYCSKRS